jgi:hypothetical protein
LSNFAAGFLFFLFICALFGDDPYQTPGTVKEKKDCKNDFKLLLHGIETGAYKDEDPQEKIEADDRQRKVFREFSHLF